MRVVISTAAADDLHRIGSYIALDNPVRARSFVKELRGKTGEIGRMPYAFPEVRQFEGNNLRRAVHGNYLIFYHVEDSRVVILHIVHAARDYERLLFPEE